MLGRAELRELQIKIQALENEIAHFATLDGAVNKLEDTVSKLSTYMERLEERAITSDRWVKIAGCCIVAVFPVAVSLSTYELQRIANKVEEVEKVAITNQLAITEFSTELKGTRGSVDNLTMEISNLRENF